MRDQVWAGQLRHREIWLNGPINDSLIEKLVVQLHNINAEDDAVEAGLGGLTGYVREEIKVFINSSGGELYAGLSGVSAIRASKSPVHTIALGCAFSMGFLLLIVGHKRSCQEFSTIMYHQMSAGASIRPTADLVQVTERVVAQQETMEELVKECTLIPEEDLNDIFTHKHDLYLTAQEALEYGVVDAII